LGTTYPGIAGGKELYNRKREAKEMYLSQKFTLLMVEFGEKVCHNACRCQLCYSARRKNVLFCPFLISLPFLKLNKIGHLLKVFT